MYVGLPGAAKGRERSALGRRGRVVDARYGTDDNVAFDAGGTRGRAMRVERTGSIAGEWKVGRRGYTSLRALLVSDAMRGRRVQRQRRMNRGIFLANRRRPRRRDARREGRDEHEQCGDHAASGIGDETSQVHDAILQAGVRGTTPRKGNWFRIHTVTLPFRWENFSS